MFSAAVAASLGRKGKFGILWLAATVGSHERSLPKNELVKLNLTEACEQIVAGEAAVPGAPPTPSPSPPSSELSSEEEQEEGRKRKKKAKPRKKKRPVKKRKAAEEEEEGEKVVIGLRVRANLMLGVCRVYDLQVSVTSSDATHLFLSLRPMLSDYGKGGKAGVTGGPRQLDMPDDGGARANTSNLDAPEENMLGFGLDFGMAAGFGGDVSFSYSRVASKTRNVFVSKRVG
ncbi:hypothetical protein BDY24DRAFT_161377 [Mrakia frigida]|uniref:Rad21/Rec8 N-terminal domain-containing protein n=1 Tax=Mrakia frigida TaxID=29902 RepID=UPI003FCBF993